MKWFNLKQNKCPKCDGDIIIGMTIEIREDFFNDEPAEKYIIHKCGFSIRESRYKQIVSSQITASLERELNKEGDKE